MTAITEIDPGARFSLRGPDTLSGTGGVNLPGQIGGRDGGAIRLGPDEWMLVADGDGASLRDAFAANDTPHSLVDISDRALSIMIRGDRATELLEMGCPRDLRTIPEGRVARTLCHGVEVILWHEADGWRVDAWRSFMPYLRMQLDHGLREMQSGL